ncbi:SDR family NAD(P)-dependent oxidoreductase [bacterium]|nr:SDR family NAD(P)-dependent oxidoreductase [bacterium]
MQDKVVVITGASKGIGAAAARVFANAGARVALLARGDTSALAAETGGLALRCDVGSWTSVQGAVQAVLARFGRLDVLINNAGTIDPISPLAEADPEAWGRAVDVNLKGVFHGMRAVLPLMRGQGGTILTVSSGAAHRPLEGWSAYCAAKAGAAMLTRAAHLEEAGHGLRIMGLSPGTVATEMQVKIRASGINPVSQIDPAAHIPPEWPARALLWMCGPAADAHLGEELSLREEWLRRAVGLA